MTVKYSCDKPRYEQLLKVNEPSVAELGCSTAGEIGASSPPLSIFFSCLGGMILNVWVVNALCTDNSLSIWILQSL